MATIIEKTGIKVMVLESVDPGAMHIGDDWLKVTKHFGQPGHDVGLRLRREEPLPHDFGKRVHVSQYCSDSKPVNIYVAETVSRQKSGWIAYHSDIDVK